MHRDAVGGRRGVAQSEHLDRQVDAPTGGDDTVEPGVRNIVPARHDAEIGHDRPQSRQKSSRTKAFSPTLANLVYVSQTSSGVPRIISFPLCSQMASLHISLMADVE